MTVIACGAGVPGKRPDDRPGTVRTGLAMDSARNAGRIITTLRSAALALLCGFLLTASPATAADAAPRETRPTVRTVEGPVRGLVRDGVNVFLGIPYAAPPVGPLRWRPPEPVRHWSAPRDARTFGASCPQITTLGVFAGPPSANEDCLSINVFAARSAGRKPVIVWIHGGGNMDGASSDYDGVGLARGGSEGEPTVVVTFNYRVGLFGTFSHPAIDAEGHLWGNYGTLDQQAALRWVRRNIASFGGDPDRVTLGGQSAGSYNTGANMLSPLAKGLFHRAIFMSSPGFSYIFPTASEVLDKGTAFALAAGCPGRGEASADCLRRLPAARILQLSGTAAAPSDFLSIIPFVDGRIIPMQPEEAWRSGRFAHVPIMGGSTKDEYTFFTAIPEYFSGWPPRPQSDAEFNDQIKEAAFCLWCRDFKMPTMASSTYSPKNYGGDRMTAYQRLNTDIAKCRELHVLRRWTAFVPVYAYDFTYSEAPFFFPKMVGLRPGASHTIDLQFLFRRYHGGPMGVNLDQTSGQPRELQGAELPLADRITSSWTRFAASGDPNGGGEAWPRFEAANGRFIVQDLVRSTKTAAQFRTEYKCDLWDRELPYAD